VRDRHQAAAAVAAEVDDPAVVGARVGLRQLEVLALGLPQDAERGVEDAGGEVLALEPLEALLRVPRAEAGVVEVLEAGRRAGREARGEDNGGGRLTKAPDQEVHSRRRAVPAPLTHPMARATHRLRTTTQGGLSWRSNWGTSRPTSKRRPRRGRSASTSGSAT